MTEQEALAKMVAPGTPRPGKWRQGVIQIWVTRACDKSCFSCTQGSNLGGMPEFITLKNFELACKSLKGYWGVVGMFGGNPAMHPQFPELCRIMEQHIPYEQRGLWCNNLRNRLNGAAARLTFNPAVSNLNVHMDREAYVNFKTWWPESMPFGLDKDSRHSPPYVAMRDVLQKDCEKCRGSGYSYKCEPGGKDPNCPGDQTCVDCCGTGQVYDESRAWELISGCDINQHWSAMIGTFRGELRAWFCEIAGAQSMLHQWDVVDCPDCVIRHSDTVREQKSICHTCHGEGKVYSYPDTGLDPLIRSTADRYWWGFPMQAFAHQVRKHCHECGVPLRGKGQLAVEGDRLRESEQVSETHKDIYKLKTRRRSLQLVTSLDQLGATVAKTTDYLGNAKK